MQYGIGTYISELTAALLNLESINVFLVSYHNVNCNEFSVKLISDHYSEISIPSPKFHASQDNSFDKKYASAVVRLLAGFIPHKGKVIFQINYLDDLAIASILKEKYKHPVVSLVHFAQWQQLFDGNRKKLSGLNIYQPSNNIEFTLSKEKNYYQVSDQIVSVTRYMKDFLIGDYEITPEKITVIPNGLDYTKFEFISKKERIILKQSLGLSKDDIVILFSGRIDPCKGIFYLLDSFVEACKHNRNLKLVLLGQGSIVDCQKRLKAFYGKVIYPGFLPKDLLAAFYKVTDIGIVPSIYDHCPYTVLEMMANKIPLILSRINGLDELLNDSQCLFVNPVLSSEGEISFNIQELSDAILVMAGDRTYRNKLVINSYDNLIRRFSAFRMAEQMNTLFQSLYENQIN